MNEIIAAVVEALLEVGAHELDPERRKQAIRDAVEAQRSRWAAFDARTATELLTELERAHLVAPLAARAGKYEPTP